MSFFSKQDAAEQIVFTASIAAFVVFLLIEIFA